MAYNTNTRLLLNFGGSGSTPGDTSQHAHTVYYDSAYTLVAGAGPFSDRAIRFSGQNNGYVQSNSILQDASSAACTVDFWVKIETMPAVASSSAVLSLRVAYNHVDDFSAGAWFAVSSDGTDALLECMLEAYNGDTTYQSEVVPLNSWVHVRARVTSTSVVFGVNGAQVGIYTQPIFSTSSAADSLLWLGGLHDSVALDCVQVLQGDNSWTGGSYTVPTAPPDDYSSGGNPELFAQSSFTTQSVTSSAYGVVGSVASGQNTVDAISSLATGALEKYPQGSNTLDAVTSRTPATEPVYDNRTRLLIKFNEAVSYDPVEALNYSLDTSFSARKVFHELPDGYSEGLDHAGNVGVYRGPFEPSHAMRFGNSLSDTFIRGRLRVASPSGIFSSDDSNFKRFDLWYALEGTQSSDKGVLFSVEFQNGDYLFLWRNATQLNLTLKKSGAVQTFTTTYANEVNGTWRHVRFNTNGGYIFIGADGQQLGLFFHPDGVAWPGNALNQITSVRIADLPPSVTDSTYRFRGKIDAIEWLEDAYQNFGYGGNYTTPLFEPGNHNSTAASGEGENTTQDITSTGAALVLPERIAFGQNTTDAVASASVAAFTLPAYGQNTLEDVTSLGRAEDGVWWTATGANTTANITNTADVSIPPIRFGKGQNTLDAVTSTETALPPDLTATGQNTVTTTSSGTATVPVPASGANTLDDATSLATGLVAFNAVSQVLTEVFSVGTATVQVSATGDNTVSVTSSGAAKFDIFSRSESTLDSVTSVGTSAVLCAGSGGNALDDVRTYFPAGYFDAFIYEVVRQQRNEHWVKQ